ncbi:hypothetical protein LR48_Vigan477s001000 [Vigna angularis]|uniref:Uncharacterized protein n=1 Tax=Phaseolus angularis TaxID=3914 RepID=A0A0L9TBR0_PHAAN|nr:hypothetical protein LR48_Vigan477s001000 [Vigna angularis]
MSLRHVRHFSAPSARPHCPNLRTFDLHLDSAFGCERTAWYSVRQLEYYVARPHSKTFLERSVICLDERSVLVTLPSSTTRSSAARRSPSPTAPIVERSSHTVRSSSPQVFKLTTVRPI